MSWSDNATPTSRTSQEATSRPISQTAPPPLRRRKSKSQDKSRTVAPEPTNTTSKKEISTTNSQTNAEQISAEVNPIPILEPSSIPKAENTDGDSSVPAESGGNKPDTDSIVTTDPTPDPDTTNSPTAAQTTEIKEPISIHKDPVPTDSTDTNVPAPEDV